MQRNRRKPVVARRSLPKEQAKLDGFFVLKVPTLGASNLIKPFFPTTKGLFELKHSDEGDIVEPEYLEEDSGDGDGEVGASLRPGVGIGDGIGSDEPDSAEEVGFEGMSNSKYEAVPHLIYKHDAGQHNKRQKNLYDGYDEDESVIRCPCKNNVDYGLMIQCETCDVWQHSICVGIRHQTNVPTHYYCEICHPRNFNCTCNKGEPIGKFLQCTICKTWQHAACVGVIRDPYSCLRCASSSSRKPLSSEEGAVRPRSGFARRGIGNKDEGIIGSKRGKRYSPPTSEHDSTYASYESTTHASTSAEAPSSITPQEAAINPPLIQTKKLDTLGALYSFVTDSLLKQNFETDHLHLHQYGYGDEESARNSEFSVHHRQMLVKYSVEFSRTYIRNSRAQDDIIQGLSILLKESTQAVLTSMAKLAHELQAIEHGYIRQGMQTPWTEVSANTCDAKVIHTLAPASWEDGDGVGVEVGTGRALIKKEVASGLLIGEFCGNAVEEVQVQREFVIADDILIQPPGPFILFLASVHIAVDARKYGSLLRFARRSCMPNTTINFGEDGGQLKVGLFATKQITADTEITIPFDYPYQILNNPIECACGNSSSCSVAMWFSQCLSTGMHLQQVLVSYHNDISAPFAQPSESDDEEENDPGEHAELGDGTKPFSKGLREHKRRRSSGVKMLESTLTPYTPPSDKLTREQRKLQAVMLSFEKMEKGKKLKKEEAQRRWKRKPRDGVAPTSDNFGNSNNNNLINANSSTREWRSRHTRKHAQDENPTNVSPSPTTNLPLSSANSLASLSVKVPYSTGKKAWLQELSFNSANNTS